MLAYEVFTDIEWGTSTNEKSRNCHIYTGCTIKSNPLGKIIYLYVNGPYLLDYLMIKLHLPVVLYVSFAVGS